MTKSEKRVLSEALEGAYSQETLDLFCRRIGCGEHGSLFAAASAGDAAEALGKKRLRQRLLKAVPECLRTRFLDALTGGDSTREELTELRQSAGAIGLLLRDAPPHLPPALAGLLLSDIRLHYIAAKPPEDGAPLSNLEASLPGLIDEVSSGGALPLGLPTELRPDEPRAIGDLLEELLSGIESDERTPASLAEAIREFPGGKGSAWGEALLPHLRARPHPSPPAENRRGAWALLLRLLQAADEGWIDASGFAALFAGLFTGKHAGDEYLDADYAADYLYYEGRGAYRNYLDSPERIRTACLKPLGRGCLGLLYLLGGVEIEYRPEARRLTPWEGIARFRLTPWGAAILDPTREAPRWERRAPIRLSSDGELARIESSSSRAELLLARIGDQIAPGCYRLTPGTVLRNAEGPESLSEALQLLAQLSQEPLPSRWEELFAELRSRSIPLKEEEGYRIYSFESDRDFLELLLSRKELKRLYLKVEGGRIAVKERETSRFLAALREAGYLAYK